MTKDDQTIVTDLRRALAQRIGPERYDTWFGAPTELRMGADRLVVATDRRFRADFVRGNFRSVLEELAAELCGKRLSVEVLVEPKLAALTAPPRKGDDSPAARTVGAAAEASPPTSAKGATAANAAAESMATHVTGRGNQVATAACNTVVEEPGAYTPFFLHGPTGTGKSHLLRGMQQALRQRWPGKRVLSLSAEQFTSQFLEALNGRGLPGFRQKVRGLDVLILDDLQFFEGKRATLVELFHTVDTLVRDRRQLVLAADRPLEELHALGRDLVGRLQGGLACEIHPADRETRLGILRQLAGRQRLPVPEEVLAAAADVLPGDARQLAGAMHRLVVTALASGGEITLSLARQVLDDLCRASVRVVRLPDIEKVICHIFGVTPEVLHSETKAKHASQPRMMAMWLARRFTRAGLSEIGSFFGRRSHSTVVSAQKKVDGWVADGATIRLADRICRIDEAVQKLELQLRTG